MLDLPFLLILTAWSAAVGLATLRAFGARPDHPADALALALPLGLGSLGLAAFGLAEVGLLTRGGIALVMATGIVGTIQNSRNSRFQFRSWTWNRPSFRWPDASFDLAIVLTMLGTLLTARTPVTDGDALCYHLQVPKVFLASGGMSFDPDLHETAYPLLVEMLYAVALAFRGPTACRLVQWLFGAALGLGVTALARPMLGSRARRAGAVALAVPAVSNGMGAPLNDVALAAMGVAALLAWLRWCDAPDWRSAALAGVFAGLAIGVKFPALVWVGVLGLALIARPGLSVKLRLVHAAVFALAVLLVGGGWYLRAYLATGNPVHPFFRQTFGGSGLDEVLDPIKRPLAVTPWKMLTALVPMTLQPSRFDSVSHQFGPAFLLFLPLLLVTRPPRRVIGIVLLGYAFLTLCLTQRQSMRFVLIAVGPMAVGVAWVASKLADRRSLAARAVAAGLAVMLLGEAAIAARRARHGLPVVLGRETEHDYLRRREPTYRVAEWVGTHLPADARIVGQDHRAFYFPRPYTMELAFRRRTGVGARDEPPGLVVADLRAAGFTHLLLATPRPETAVEFDGTLGRRLTTWLNEHAPLYDEDVTDPDGVTRRYAVYDLGDGPALAGDTERRGVSR